MTKDDLEQIDLLLQKRFEENNSLLRKEFKTDMKSLRQDVKKDIKAEVEPLHERLDAQRDQISGLEQKIMDVEKNLSAKISLEATDLAEIISGAIFPKLDEHDQQIAQLQEEAGLKPSRH